MRALSECGHRIRASEAVLFTAIRRRAFNTARSVPGQVRHEHRMLFADELYERLKGRKVPDSAADAQYSVYLATSGSQRARKPH